MVNVAQCRNAESRRTQRICLRISSASPRFNPFRPAIPEHGYVLTPGRYVGAVEVEADGVPFARKTEGLTREIVTQFQESENLQSAILARLHKLGFALPEVGE